MTVFSTDLTRLDRWWDWIETSNTTVCNCLTLSPLMLVRQLCCLLFGCDINMTRQKIQISLHHIWIVYLSQHHDWYSRCLMEIIDEWRKSTVHLLTNQDWIERDRMKVKVLQRNSCIVLDTIHHYQTNAWSFGLTRWSIMIFIIDTRYLAKWRRWKAGSIILTRIEQFSPRKFLLHSVDIEINRW